MLTAQKMADVLNEALKLDPACISSLWHVRRQCSKALAEHPTIQVYGQDDGSGMLRFMGLLNGMLLSAGSTDVLVATEDDDKNQNTIGFSVRPYADFLPKEESGIAIPVDLHDAVDEWVSAGCPEISTTVEVANPK